MNKSAIRNYAVWARTTLMEAVRQKAFEYEITSNENDVNLDSINGVLLTKDQKEGRRQLIAKIKENGYDETIEEVAYTWFNRFTALRFMEVNEYLPTRVRVFSDESGAFNPDILKEALSVELDGLDRTKVIDFIEKQNNEELYKYLLITQCNALSDILSPLFTKLEKYVELLLPNNLLRKDSVLDKLVKDIPEEDWKEQVEIIGWLYQYYISEPKEVLINAKKQYQGKDIPFVTQLFTPEWIVKYMVQNSLGRYWIENTNNDFTKYNWEYYLNNECVTKKNSDINLEEIKIIDPCMGSGHILVYVFDVLLQLYQEKGYTEREAATFIIEKNLYGIDISKRAYQIATFSIMMKARKHNRAIFRENITKHLYLANSDNVISSEIIDFIAKDNLLIRNSLKELTIKYKNIEEYGSLIELEDQKIYEEIAERIKSFENRDAGDLIEQVNKNICINNVLPLIELAICLSQKYEVVITNPPYIGNKYLTVNLKKYLETYYPKYKQDIFAAFIIRCKSFTKTGGHIGLLSPYVWMFISSYEDLRRELIDNMIISSLVQLEYNAFEAACVPVCAFTLKNSMSFETGEYVRLTEFTGIENQAPKVIEAVQNKLCGYRYNTLQKMFNKIPGAPIAYWIGKGMFKAFDSKSFVSDIGEPKQGMATTDNNKFLRRWQEVIFNKIYFTATNIEDALNSCFRWFPYNKGGEYRKWYGNNEFIVNYENDGAEIKSSVLEKYPYLSTPDFVVKNTSSYFKKSITWSYISSTNFGVRASSEGFIFDVSGSSLFVNDLHYKYMLSLLCSKLSTEFINIINPTMNIQAGSVGNIPVIFSEEKRELIEINADRCVGLSKTDWDSYENSWDFKKHPLI